MKFWRGTRKIKAVKEEDHEVLAKGKSKGKGKGKGRMKHQIPPVFPSDSDSDFKLPKLTTWFQDRKSQGDENRYGNESSRIDQRLENIESQLNIHDDLQRSSAQLQVEINKLRVENCTLSQRESDLRASLNCLICKSVAKFPWRVTLCCSVLMCHVCFETWISMQPTCPHCRADLSLDSCEGVHSTRSLELQLSIWRGDETEEPEVLTD